MNSLVDISISELSDLTEIESSEPTIFIDSEQNQEVLLEISTQVTKLELDQPSLVITEISNSNINTVDTSKIVIGEVPSGDIDGINNTFTSSMPFIVSSLEVFVNGIREKVLDDYNTIGNNTIFFNFSPEAGEHMVINYIKI